MHKVYPLTPRNWSLLYIGATPKSSMSSASKSHGSEMTQNSIYKVTTSKWKIEQIASEEASQTFIECGISYEIINNIPKDIEGEHLWANDNQSVHPPKITVTKTFSIVICGDLNAKNPGWGSPEKDTRGDLVGDILENLNLTILNTGCGTRMNNDGSYSHLDIAFVSSNL